MNILFLTHYTGRGGASQALLALVDGLKTYGINSYVLLANRKGELAEELEMRNVEYAVVPFWAGVINEKYTSSMLFPIKQIKNLLCQVYTAIIARPYVRKWNIDIIHANSTYVTYGCILSWLTGKQGIWHLREDIKGHFKSVFFQNKHMMDRFTKHVNCVIAVSEYIEKSYSEYLKNVPCEVIYDGARICAEKTKYDLHSPVKIVYLGGENVSKGWPDLYLLYQGMKSQQQLDYRIYLPGFSKEVIKNYVKENKLEEDFLNYLVFCEKMDRKQVDSFRTEMDVCFQPSANEAFGLVTVESMLIGLPVIAVDSGANRELIEDGITGYLYEKGNSENIAEKVVEFVQNKEMRAKIIANARRKAEENYTPDSNARNIYNVYCKLMGIVRANGEMQ